MYYIITQLTLMLKKHIENIMYVGYRYVMCEVNTCNRWMMKTIQVFYLLHTTKKNV